MSEECRNDQNASAQNASKSKFTGPLKDRLQGKKSNAKRIGVKSVFSYGDRSLAITAFGKGNSAKIVLHAPNGGRDAEVPQDTEDFTIRHIDDEIEFRGALSRDELESMLHNPTEEVAQDKLKLKGTLEKEFFGKEYPNSNIYIQLIHNILDVQKILGLYINDMLYSVNNLQITEFKIDEIQFDKDGEIIEPENLYDRIEQSDDILGKSLKEASPDEKEEKRKEREKELKSILSRLRPYLGFFGDVFVIPKKDLKDSLTPDDEFNLNVLRILSALRHYTAHGKKELVKKEFPIFDKDKSGDQLLSGTKGKWDIVEDNFKNRIDRINNSFLENSTKNVYAIYKTLGHRSNGSQKNLSDTQKKELVEDYYNFSIVKQCKNLGVNIVTLRENIIDNHYSEIKKTICDPHRPKIYTIADFLIYRHLKNNPDIIANTVKRLQSSIDEDYKKRVYESLAESLWVDMEEQLAFFFDESCVETPFYIRDCPEVKNVPLECIDSVVIKKGNKKDNYKTNISANRIVCINLKKGLKSDFVDGFKLDKSIPPELFNNVRLKEVPRELFDESVEKVEVPLDLVEDVTVKVLIPSVWIEDVKIGKDNGIPFVMLLSFLCNFLEGKEINELLTAYIHKFENIQSFIDTLIELGEPLKFTQPYSAFDTMDNQYAGEVARQLRVLASIGKMKPDLSGIKEPLYFDAIRILGAEDAQATHEFYQEYFEPDRKDEKYDEKKTETNPFRNFVINNVIKSRRFLFLVRYSKPKTVRALMNNAKIVRYTLSRLPVEQIVLYYKRAKYGSNDIPDEQLKKIPLKEMLDELTGILTGMKFQKVLDKKDSIVNKKDAENVERLKAQIGLYLTVAYVAIKQLVKINARYYIAYQILERDTELMNSKVKALGDPTAVSKHYSKYGNSNNKILPGLIKYFLAEEEKRDYKPVNGIFDKEACRAHLRKIDKDRYITKKWRDIFNRNINQSNDICKTGFLPVAVRNLTEHLKVLMLIQDYVGSFRKNGHMQSYFELYHFLMQSMLFQINGLDLKPYQERNDRGMPSSYLINTAYFPLGYNLARYKNLTVEALFDEDGYKGQNFIANKCYKQAFNRIATAKRNGKLSETIEALKNEFIEQYESEEEANNAVRLGEVWSYEDEARQSGLKGEPFPEMVLRMMKFKKFTKEEVAKVQHAYDAAKRKSENR